MSDDDFISFGEVEITGHPAARAFQAALEQGALTRTEAIEEAQRLAGMAVYDAGNTKDYELFAALASIVARALNENAYAQEGAMPDGVRHVVLGHAAGQGSAWFLKDMNGMRVQEFVNAHVPEGEQAWVVACHNHDRNFATLTGEMLTSQGRQPERSPLR